MYIVWIAGIIGSLVAFGGVAQFLLFPSGDFSGA